MRALGAFASAFLVLVPTPWHWRTRNSGTLSMIAWLFIINMILAINASIWADNVRISAVPWCDLG
jgi:pheromone a factor receptor